MTLEQGEVITSSHDFRNNCSPIPQFNIGSVAVKYIDIGER